MMSRRPALLKLPGVLLLGWALAGCRPPTGSAPERTNPYALALARCGDSAGASLRLPPGSVAVLDGSDSGLAGHAAGDRGRLRYSWRQVAGPAVRLARTDLARTEAVFRSAGDYVFELTVTAGGETSEPCPVRITVAADARAPAPPTPGTPEPGATSTAARTPVPAPAGRSADFTLLASDGAELVRVFGEKTGLTLRVDPGWQRPEDLARRPVNFLARNVPPDLAIEMAARLLGGTLVRDRRDAAYVTSGLGWLSAEPQLARFYPLATKAPVDDGRAILELAREACRGPLFACPAARIDFDAARGGLQATGPGSMHARLAALVEELGPGGGPLPPRPPLDPEERRRDEVLERRLNVVLVDRPLPAAALELGVLLGVPIAWEEPPGGTRDVFVSLRGDGRPAREMLAELAGRAGCAGFSWVRGGGLWLYRAEDPGESAEPVWVTAEVRGWPAAPLRAAGVLPGAAVHAVRAGVRPPSWQDPATLCSYYAHTDRLVIIAPPPVQREALRLLHDLVERGGRGAGPGGSGGG